MKPASKKKTKAAQSGEASPQPTYIPYARAFSQLEENLDEVTAEEIAAWVFMGSKDGGLDAYLSANELDPPPRFFFGSHLGERDYLPLVYRCWFKAEGIATFEPGERFITGKKLLEMWATRNAIPPGDRIRIATEESRLLPLHPTLGLTEATFSDDPFYVPLEDGLFSLSEIKKIEAEDFPQKAVKADDACNKRSVSAMDIMQAFKIYPDDGTNIDWWKKMMRNASDNGLVACRHGGGKRSRGGSFWFPDEIAGWLVDRNTKGLEGSLAVQDAKTALKKFPDYADAAELLCYFDSVKGG